MADRDRRTPYRGIGLGPVVDREHPPTPVELSWDHEVTPRQALAHVDSRVKSSTREQMGALEAVRSEVQTSIREIDRKVDELGGHVVNLSVSQASMAAKLDLVLEDRAIERHEVSMVRVETVKSQLKVSETSEIEAINARRERGKFWRDIALRALAGVGALWAAVSALILSGRC